MNKKLLFAAMSLAALAACTNDDFESQNVVAEESSPVQFEVINDGFTRASMNGTKIAWNVDDGDLFTLYHGGTASGTPIELTGYQNATYTAVEGDGAATLTTPSVIKSGSAIMVWPVDTAFVNTGAAVAISIPQELDNIENHIPYVSDVVAIAAHTGETTPGAAGTGKYNEAGYNRKYPVFMRPMAHQLTINADYAGTDATLAELYTGDDPIETIKVTSVALQANTEMFTTKIPLAFTAKSTAVGTRWDAAEPNNAWSHVTGFAATPSTQVTELTTKVVTGNESAKFLILPQAAITTADNTSAVVVNTTYGKVQVAGTGTSYTSAEQADAWYRYLSASSTAATGETKAATAETTGDNAGKFKTTAEVKNGMMQTINAFTLYTDPTATGYTGASSGIAKGEPVGAATTRYVKVLLKYLDMADLHITSDKQLRDAARVWKHMGITSVTVFLDGDDNNEFAISQETIETINTINAASTTKKFTVKPCAVTGEACNTIVITGGGDVPTNLDFIVANGTTKADVALNEGETWKWAGTVTVAPTSNTGIAKFINRGTMNNAETATLAIYDNATTPAQLNIPFENALDATWNVTAGTLDVQFDVTNNGTLNISKGAAYRQHIIGSTATTFINAAETLEERFVMNDPSITAAQKAAFVEQIGKVNNSGVFATGGTSTTKGVINNYGLIEHADVDAKTFITANQTSAFALTSAFKGTSSGSANQMGRINLPYSNKDENNVSINNAAASGLVSVTVSSGNGAPANGKLDLTSVGNYVNYCIVEGGITEINKVNDSKIKFVEFNSGTTEIAWTVTSTNITGLIVLSPVNIHYGTTVTSSVTYIGAEMYVGGGFTPGVYNSYFGTTGDNVPTFYYTY